VCTFGTKVQGAATPTYLEYLNGVQKYSARSAEIKHGSKNFSGENVKGGTRHIWEDIRMYLINTAWCWTID
jgi:hypothetical protein